MDDLTLGQLLELATLTDSQAFNLSGLSARQWRRYRAGGAVPRWLARLLFTCSGQLGTISKAWHGWRLVGETLFSPEGERYPLEWFASLPWYFAQLQEERRQLREKIDLLESRRIPPAVLPKLRLVWDADSLGRYSDVGNS